MTDIRARLAGALIERAAEHGYAMSRDTANDLVGAQLSLPGIAIVELPDAEEEWPGGYIWLNGDVRSAPGKVRHYQEDSRLVPAEAREIAAALLAAANAAEANA